MIRAALVLTGMALMIVPAMAQSNADVSSARSKFMEAFNKADAQGVAALYAKDALLMPDRAPKLEGQDAIAAYWQGGLQQGREASDLCRERSAHLSS